jgi:hypothetical protein
MIQVTFETAGLAAAAAKAARVAPSKGMAFDQAAGIMIEGRPDETDHKAITVKATNLEVDYLEWVRPTEIKADGDFEWRVPSQLFAGFVGGLPIGSGKTVTLSQDEPGTPLVMKSGRTRAKIHVITGRSYRTWEPFDPAGLVEVEGFANRVNQASWATDPQTVPFSGIHINGTHLLATDRYKMVRVPCPVTLDDSVTVPLDVLAPILNAVEDVRLGVAERHLLLMPDEYTQMQAVLFSAAFPDLSRIMSMEDFNLQVNVPRVPFRDAVQRMLSLVGRGERYPMVTLDITHDGIGLYMSVDGVGEMTDEVETDATVEADAELPVTMHFSPDYLIKTFDHSKDPHINMHIRTDQPKRAVKMSDTTGYDVWIAPRKKGDRGSVKEDES